MNPEFFHPYAQLARELLPAIDTGGDGAHDFSHIARVWRNAFAILAEEGGDAEVVAPAVLLHDSVHVPKNSPDRGMASRMAAERAAAALRDLGWPEERVDAVAHAIESHSFSAGIAPRTLEARIVQDADRLDAIGAIGIARCFYTAGRMGSGLYDHSDPTGSSRPLNDVVYALDHFPNKLFQVAAGFGTATGQRLARERDAVLRSFHSQFLTEVI